MPSQIVFEDRNHDTREISQHPWNYPVLAQKKLVWSWMLDIYELNLAIDWPFLVACNE